TLSVSPLLVHECHAAQSHFQLCNKLFSGKVAFNAKPFLGGAVENYDRRRPERVKTMGVRWGCFDVHGDRKETLIDEGCDLFIGVRLGFQPNASASSGSGAEVE